MSTTTTMSNRRRIQNVQPPKILIAAKRLEYLLEKRTTFVGKSSNNRIGTKSSRIEIFKYWLESDKSDIETI